VASRRLKAEERSRPWVEPEQLLALLDAADRHARPVFATLAGTGIRPGEALALLWRDVNLATSTISIRESKTRAGVRQVDLPMGAAEALRELKARASAGAAIRCSATARGGPRPNEISNSDSSGPSSGPTACRQTPGSSRCRTA